MATTERRRDLLRKAEISQVKVGIVSGIAGVLFNEGTYYKFEVIAFVTQTRSDIPDARAATRILQTMMKLVPSARIDLTRLHQETKRIEFSQDVERASQTDGGVDHSSHA